MIPTPTRLGPESNRRLPHKYNTTVQSFVDTGHPLPSLYSSPFEPSERIRGSPKRRSNSQKQRAAEGDCQARTTRIIPPPRFGGPGLTLAVGGLVDRGFISRDGEQAPARRAHHPTRLPRPFLVFFRADLRISLAFNSASDEKESRKRQSQNPRPLRQAHTRALLPLYLYTILTEANLRTRQAEHIADEVYALATRQRAREAELEDVLRERGEEGERARGEARRSDVVVGEYAGLVRRSEGQSPVSGRTSFVLDGHGRSASGTRSVDADAGSTPTLLEPPVPASSPSAGEGSKGALDPQAQLEKRDDTEALETRVAELTASSSKLKLALAASQRMEENTDSVSGARVHETWVQLL
ncbi:hypothetical protein B0H14DRAFT_2568995 [Mycena olivaceomarginata]|nr:hypothetical protein B0H14DRAFT_2568995 [Mycena olivaceomarginata]